MLNLLQEEGRYTDDFVLEIEGGNFTAARIAEECGLDYVEEIFPNHFHFKVRLKFKNRLDKNKVRLKLRTLGNALYFDNFEHSEKSIFRNTARVIQVENKTHSPIVISRIIFCANCYLFRTNCSRPC